MAMTKTVALVGILGLIVGAGAMWLVAPDGRPARTPAMQQALSANAGPAVAPGQALGAAAMRSAIRDEVRAAFQDQAATIRTKQAALAKRPAPEDETAAATDREPPAPTPVYQAARAHLAERTAQGAWTEADRDRLRIALGDMNVDERQEIMKQVIVAANRGQIRVQVQGPLF
jgi:predicted lipid-binding transport protein (Tim44 family)